MSLLLKVLRDEAQAFGAAFSILIIIMIFASSGIYLFEHKAQPEAFSNIPEAVWWSVATLTTVGYGDVIPATIGGKTFGVIIMICFIFKNFIHSTHCPFHSRRYDSFLITQGSQQYFTIMHIF